MIRKQWLKQIMCSEYYDQFWTTTKIKFFKIHLIIHLNILYSFDYEIGNSYITLCPPARRDNPRALASGLSPVQVN